MEKMIAELKGEEPPFFPLFYRVNGSGGIHAEGKGRGSILYPPSGRGRYYRDEILSAIAWCERFPKNVRKFEFRGAQEFIPGNDELPFAFVQDMFDARARIVAETAAQERMWKEAGCVGPKPYNILEKVLKLILNSLYGKMAQSIGTPGQLPNATNPFYAGAITAGTRAKLQMAALHNPHNVIFFATDAITSLGPLEGLPTVREKILGEWEHAEEIDTAAGAAFVHPGIYSFYNLKGKPVLKMRGCKIDLGRDFMMKNIRAGWKRGDHCFVNKHGEKTLVPKQLIPQYREMLRKGEELILENVIRMDAGPSLMTLGLAVSTRENWKKMRFMEKTSPRTGPE